MPETTAQRLLREAVDRVGLEAVALRLRAPADLVDLWLRGLAAMPDRKLLPLVDLLQKPGGFDKA